MEQKKFNRVINAIYNKVPNAIFCGSVALYLTGKLDRLPHDVDIIVKSRADWNRIKTIFLYSDKDTSFGERQSDIESISIQVIKEHVDVFFMPDANYEKLSYQFNMLNVSVLEEIILYKLDFIKRLKKVSSVFKHIVDLIKLDCPNDMLYEAINKSPCYKDAQKGTYDDGHYDKRSLPKNTPWVPDEDLPF